MTVNLKHIISQQIPLNKNRLVTGKGYNYNSLDQNLWDSILYTTSGEIVSFCNNISSINIKLLLCVRYFLGMI